ncbi:sugar ABC transporter substrate-binding protein [Sporanaerobium hydrogeniformans]|uniref:Sugar ABC transporter substrate-binding protein n=1 Tax=Sporanaerobium hydrogeniformans TaxID=3072179 RepID=A0AC61DFV8_9FIRM|nr:extracellular solute-binding protein [Sporanaerobium hydrogeniformans]PHV71832.1 sugar ABC transporter substrate-binding protein [Sporanaerobium hydrogeniformans]
MKKKTFAKILSTMMIATCLTACQGGNTPEQAPAAASATPTEATQNGNAELEGTLVFALWDNVSIELFESMDLEGRFQKLYPKANIEFEKLKDDSEYWNAMKVRASANQLPDIMYNKTFTLSRFQDYLLDLSTTEAVKNNNIAEGYRLNGKILGIPEKMTCEYVYYWKDMFKEAQVEVPTTWTQFEEVAKKLQAYYGSSNPNFSAIAIGGKDEWPTYPFVEFMPALISGNGQNWNTMSTQDEPFAEGTDIYKAYQKIHSLFQSGAFGKDPLGIGNDQATALFAQQQSAILASGGWALANIKEGANSIDNLGTFYLPVRDSESEPFRTITQGDSFLSVTSSSKNPELAKAFVEFYFSDAWYPDYINAITDDNTMKTVTKEKDPVLAEADTLQPNKELVMYDGGGDNFTALVSATTFDYKKLGAEMLIKGYDLNSTLAELNAKWKAARQSLNIQ